MAAVRHCFTLLTGACLVCSLFYLQKLNERNVPGFGDWHGRSTEHSKNNIELDQANTSAFMNNTKTILLWTPYWTKDEHWKLVFKRFYSGQCSVSDCSIILNRHVLASADAIVFNAPNLRKPSDLPKKRNNNQIWVYFSLEPPPVISKVDANFVSTKETFNWTMTYRRDSDVYMPYGQLLLHDSSVKNERRNLWKIKQMKHANITSGALVSWMVSHCHTSSKREDYANGLKRYIPVDIYGKCGNLTCGTRVTIANYGKDSCKRVMEDYYFYLSFENSLCKDYVTEKFYKALASDVVPVVLGGALYSSLAPKGSYINTLDFNGPKELAQYLKKVAASETLYNSFFAWKKHYTVDIGHPIFGLVCDLCARLHGANTSGYDKEIQLPNRKYDLLKPEREPINAEIPAQNSSDYLTTNLQAGSVYHNHGYSDVRKWFFDDSQCFTWTNEGPKKVSYAKNRR